MFKKGQHIYEIASWNNGGKFFVREAIVHACGKKRMVLNSLDGTRCLGHNYRPTIDQYEHRIDGQPVRCLSVVIDLPSLDAAKTLALELAAEWLVREIAHTERCIAHNPDSPAYVRLMTESLATLKAATPEVVIHT
jgi:hypothetical protein